ncbi:MAG: peptidoglycan DD-metalloendopeptidase family protein [Propionibacteriaceae bacterium]|nr:peptidoglycan DD-metalloendopeptidase family protein [Propionibacteriaceae bacterium]
MTAGLVAPLASADTLSDLRTAVQQKQQEQGIAREEIQRSQENVNSRTQELITSQNQLAEAQAVLADISVELQMARDNDARIAAELEEARAELERAKERVAKAEAEVAAQVALIGQAARESFQQQTDLRGLTVVFGSESPAEMSQRLQWNTTIFDTQAAEKSRLDAVRDELEAARRIQAEIEAKIAHDKEESAKAVARIARLERQAEAQRATVARLVSANEAARQAAQSELDADQNTYRTLEADERRLQSDIEKEIARIKAEEEAKRRAEEEARRKAQEEAERKAAEARRLKEEAEEAERQRSRDAAEKKRQAEQAERDAREAQQRSGPPRQEAPSRSTTREGISSFGFQRPVQANYGSPFGRRFHPILKYWRNHNGVDMGARTGTPIYASQSGTVLKAGPNGGFGNFVLIGHGNVINGKYVTTGYAHQSRIAVRTGQRVERGQLIGYVGNTGLSTTPHLHFELRLDGTPVNPVRYVA